MLTSTTTVPAISDIPAIIAMPDLLSASAPKGSPTVVFLGDSINWEYVYGTGASVWSTFMAPFGMANYGVSGQTTQSLLFQLSLGQIAGINPSVVVLDIGGDNLLEGDTPQATAAGVLADVNTIHQYLTQAQVFVLGILPGMQSPTSPYRTLGAETNQLVSQMLANDPKATFLNLGSIFLQPDGTISTSMMFDYLHPTAQGYVDLTAQLLPSIEQALFGNLPTSPVIGLPSVTLTSVGVPTTSTPTSAIPIAPQ